MKIYKDYVELSFEEFWRMREGGALPSERLVPRKSFIEPKAVELFSTSKAVEITASATSPNVSPAARLLLAQIDALLKDHTKAAKAYDKAKTLEDVLRVNKDCDQIIARVDDLFNQLAAEERKNTQGDSL